MKRKPVEAGACASSAVGRNLPSRRQFMGQALAAGLAVPLAAGAAGAAATRQRPLNVVFVFADQWRAQAMGYAGDPNVKTPNLDALARRSINFRTAVANCPVCAPCRASLITGQYPLTHGVFINDVHLGNRSPSIARAFKEGGYDTAYIGKWHVNGRGRLHFIPPEDRQGFDFWAACECTHEYNHSIYYRNENKRLVWEGYDAEAQTRLAQAYIRGEGRKPDRPFMMMLSWGPPHNPYQTAPQRFKAMYDPNRIALRANVPEKSAAQARRDLAGYYAHCSALDSYVGDLLGTIREAGLEEDTLFVFTSDHGDMLGSHGEQRKQRPWDESILVPLLMSCPALFGQGGKEISVPLGLPDLMPTLLGLCGRPIPEGVEGTDVSGFLRGDTRPPVEAGLIACYAPFGEWTRSAGGREYRGIRTDRYTYVRDRRGAWMLYDNEADPYQLANLAGRPEHADLQNRLDALLGRLLRRQKDEFLSGWDYIRRWGYKVDQTGTAPTDP